MKNNGLTITMIFLAESANYGEGVGNITTLKKMTRGNYEQYSYISRQAMRYSLVRQLNWDTTPVDGKSGVVQFAPTATIKEYPEIDLFGYMKTTSKDDGKNEKGGAATRSAVVRLSNAIALEPYQSDLEFLTNMGLAQRDHLENAIAQSEIQRSYFSYTVSIDLERVGEDNGISLSAEEKSNRIITLLEGIEYLYRDIKGRRENLSPLFIIGGCYKRKNPFFENQIKLENNNLKVKRLAEIVGEDEALLKSWEENMQKLDPIEINETNGIKEWYEETRVGQKNGHNRSYAKAGNLPEIEVPNSGWDIGHPGEQRHSSHLVGLFPGTLINKENKEYCSK